MVAGALNSAPFAGFKRLTTGGSLTIMLTGVEVVVTPELSVATAVKAYLPEGALFHVMLYWSVPLTVPVPMEI